MPTPPVSKPNNLSCAYLLGRLNGYPFRPLRPEVQARADWVREHGLPIPDHLPVPSDLWSGDESDRRHRPRLSPCTSPTSP